jgi:photosystem II stability/assembly factor-like uncharacterized protein
MNKYFTLIILLAVFNISAKLNAQSSWELLNPKPAYQKCLDIAFVSATNGFILNETQLLKTENSGLTWDAVSALTFTNAKDIAIKNSIGYIVGLNGLVYKTTDNGGTWSQVNTTFAYAYTTVNIIDDDNVILSSNNRIVKTTNGGITWTSITVTGFPSIIKTFFTSTLIGHAVCSQGKILKTINGGTSWYVTNSIDTIPAGYLAVTFVNENVGYASREHSDVLKTTDGGETWTMITSPGNGVNRFYFLDETRGYSVCENGMMYKTTNGGSSWTTMAYRAGYDYAGYYGVYFADSNTGFVVGERGRIAKTTNGGSTWTEYSPTYDDILKTTFVNESIGYSLVKIYSKILKTIDGGNSWQIVGAVSSEQQSSGSDFCFVNQNVGFATTTLNGRIFKTTDGGVNWTPTTNPILDDGYNTKVFFFDENIGFVSGGFNSPRTCKTTDGGATWQTIANRSYTKIQFLTSQIAYGIYGGTLYKTANGGISWTQLTTVTFSSYYFLDENIGFTINNNTFRKTIDGGLTWTATTLLNTGIPDGLKFVNEQLGYVIRDNISIYRTINGGQSWIPLVGFYNMNHFDLLGTRIYASGTGGIIQASVIPDSLLANSDFDEESSISIYPNPTSGYINISSQDLDLQSADIYNLAGEKIMHLSIENMNMSIIDIRNLSKGMYLVKINTNHKTSTTKKIIIN